MRRVLLSMCVLVTLAGCALPAGGPRAIDIRADEFEKLPAPDYLVVNIDEKVTNIAGQYRPTEFSNYFSVASGRPTIVIDDGDQVLVNVWEAGADGLFSSAASKATQIQATVDGEGRIFVPYVGLVHAAGRPVEAVRTSIESALKDKAIQPQVQVLVAESVANSATVVGDVKAPGRYPISISGIRVLDLLALAGGSSAPTYETRLTLKRGERTASANYEDLFDNPRENVPIRPGDTLLVSNTPRSITVFGATRQHLEIPFNSRYLSLAEALARAGGLNDLIADAGGIFIFRFEVAEIAKQLDERAVTVPEGTKVPVIYRLNLRDPQAFFFTQMFEMRDEDVIYVAIHPTAEFARFLNIVQPLLNLVSRGSAVTNVISN